MNTAYLDFLKALNFKSDDTVCLGFSKGKGDWTNQFQPFRKLSEPEFADNLSIRNNSGENIYISMAAFVPGSEHRTKECVSSIRHAFIEKDSDGPKTIEEIGADIKAGLIQEPQIAQESSTGKVQVIWNVSPDDFTVNGKPDIAKHEAVIKSLQLRYSADPQAVDTARFLRVAGFRNCKYPEKPEVRLISVENIPPYRFSDFKIEVAREAFSRKPATWMDDPIPEGSRNGTLTAIGGALRRIGMDEESIYAVLTLKNQNQCTIPLSDSEIRTISASVARYEPARTTLLVGGKPIDGVDALKPTQPVITASPVSLWDRATPFCQIEDTPMEWIIPGLIVRGETTMMTGDFGSFKSYMTYFIADAITEGGTFARRTAQKHPVLVLDRENSKSTVSLRRYLVGNLRDKQNAKLLGRFTTPASPEITDAELLELCRTIHPFVIIDSMQDFHPGKKENDTDDMTQFSIEVNRLIDAGAVAVLIIHHVPKSGKGKASKYRGTTAIPGGVGGALFVEKIGRTGVKIEGFKTRDGEDSTVELVLQFPSEAEINAKTGRVTYTIVRGGIDRSSGLKESVLSYVQTHSRDGLSRNKIAKGLGGDRNEVLGLIKSLLDDGKLVESDAGIVLSSAEGKARCDANL